MEESAAIIQRKFRQGRHDTKGISPIDDDDNSDGKPSTTCTGGTVDDDDDENASNLDVCDDDEAERIDRSHLFSLIFVTLFGMAMLFFKFFTNCVGFFAGRDEGGVVADLAETGADAAAAAGTEAVLLQSPL